MLLAFNEVSKDLAGQVLDAWQRGTVGSNTLKLALRGSLNPRQLRDLKASIQKNVHEIKALKERVFEPNQVTFEVDYTGTPQQLGERLKSGVMPGFNVKVVDATERAVVLDLHRQ